MDLPDSTTKRLRSAREDLAQAQQRWQGLLQTACEMAGVDPEQAQINLQAGVIRDTGSESNPEDDD